MNKILSITLISAASLILFAGCGASTGSLQVKTNNNAKIAHAIEKAGQKAGWKITEFKSNEVIAEKTEGEETVSSSVKFDDGQINFSNESDTADLREAIEEELTKEKSAH